MWRAPPKPARPPSRRRFLYAAAAVAAVAAPAAVLLSRPDLLADHSTTVGERRKVTLEDGSTVELAGSSSLSVDFSAQARRVVLHDGEAFFDVARDDTRPFVVQAADGFSRALGTSFDVKRQGTEVTVAVVEHAVAVSSAGSRVVVEQGQQIRYGAHRLGKVGEADLAQVEAWRRDRLIFHETPLGEVVADLERYRGGRIVMTDARLRDIPVTAVFDARQADAALDTIASSLAIRLRRVTRPAGGPLAERLTAGRQKITPARGGSSAGSPSRLSSRSSSSGLSAEAMSYFGGEELIPGSQRQPPDAPKRPGDEQIDGPGEPTRRRWLSRSSTDDRKRIAPDEHEEDDDQSVPQGHAFHARLPSDASL